MIGAVVLGTGSYLPEQIVTNYDLETIVDTSDEWITSRTGIKTRRIADQRVETTSGMAVFAAEKALKMAGITAHDIDLIIVASITPDMAMPSCACLVQHGLDAVNAVAFDINAACSGFVFALDIALQYIKSNQAIKILLIGAETMSSRIDWQDRNTCVLFGDGAGACVLTGSEAGSGVLGSTLFSDGSLWDLLYLDNAPRRRCPVSPGREKEMADDTFNRHGSAIHMQGRDVFKHAVRAMEKAVVDLLEKTGTAMEEISLMVPHQANIRILQSLRERLGLPGEKVYINVNKYGNTSAASVPIALDEAQRDNRLKRGDLLLLCVFGGGFTWGTTLMRW